MPEGNFVSALLRCCQTEHQFSRPGGRYNEAWVFEQQFLTPLLYVSERFFGLGHCCTSYLTSILIERSDILAEWYITLGRFQEAEPLLVKRLEKSRAALGPEHPDTLHALGT